MQNPDESVNACTRCVKGLAELVELIAGQVQEKPGKERKVIRRVKSLKRETQVCGKKVPGNPGRQQIAGMPAVPEQHEGQDCQQKPRRLVDGGISDSGEKQEAIQQIQRDHQKHAGTDQCENTEKDRVILSQQQGYCGHHYAAEKNDHAALKRMVSQGPTEAGEQDKGPADALLPDVCAHAVVPGHGKAYNVSQIPHEVV